MGCRLFSRGLRSSSDLRRFFLMVELVILTCGGFFSWVALWVSQDALVVSEDALFLDQDGAFCQ